MIIYNFTPLFTAVFTTIAFSQKWIKQGIVKLPKQFSFTIRTNKQRCKVIHNHLDGIGLFKQIIHER